MTGDRVDIDETGRRTAPRFISTDPLSYFVVPLSYFVVLM